MKIIGSGVHLSTRIFITIIVLVILPFIIMLQYVRFDLEAILRKEVSLKIVQNLSKSENEISQIFNKMTSISNVFYRDAGIAEAFSDFTCSYYERTCVFNNLLDQIAVQNLYDNSIENMKITIFDKKKQAYANWSLNYQDFSYLLEEDWIKESIGAKGYIVWSMPSKGYDASDYGKNKISLARAIINEGHVDNVLGTIIISIDQQGIADILDTYKYSDLDSIFASTQDGEILFYNNNILDEYELGKLARKHINEQNGDSVLKINDRRYLMSFYTIKLVSAYSRNQLKIFYLTDYQKLDDQINSLMIKINIMCIIFIAVALLVAFLIAKWIARPIKVLSHQMKNYRVGENPKALVKGRNDEIGEIYSVFHNMSVHINDLFAKLRQEQITKEKYQYESLRSKMSPHFLFNTLNSIRWMAIIRKADNIRESIDSLAEILKYSLTRDDEMVDLAKELEIVKSYCYIQNMRFGNSYSLIVNLDEDLKQCMIIKFILQPTVENIFKHAFSQKSSGGIITIYGYVKNKCLELSISDNGKGFSQESIGRFYIERKNKAYQKEGSGIGLSIIDERIAISFGKEYGIDISNNDEGGASVYYHLPVIIPLTEKEENV